MNKSHVIEAARRNGSDSSIYLIAPHRGADQPLIERPLTGPMARYVEGIWLGLNNRNEALQILPDGCVDVVFQLGADNAEIFAYGSTTRPAVVSLGVGAHYLGVRFQPGMARHFLNHAPASLTDQRLPVDRFLDVDLEKLARGVERGEGLMQLETALLSALQSRQPELSAIDRAVRFLSANYGDVSVAEVARQCGKSVRQIERLFVATLGLTPKVYCSILRMRGALHAISRHNQADLAGIAMAAGYTDQSHMSKDFARLTGRSPGSFR